MLARHANLILAQNRFFVRHIIMHITNRTALALQMFVVSETYARKPDSVEIIVSCWVKAYQPITRKKPIKSGLTRRAGRHIDPGDHRYSSHVVGAVEIRRISEPGMEPSIPPGVRWNCPLLVGEAAIILLRGWGAAVELEPISDSSQ